MNYTNVRSTCIYIYIYIYFLQVPIFHGSIILGCLSINRFLQLFLFRIEFQRLEMEIVGIISLFVEFFKH